MFVDIESNLKILLCKNKIFSMNPHNPKETIQAQNPNSQNIHPKNLINFEEEE